MDATPWVDKLVAQLRESGILRDPAVEAALRRVPRHRFVERFYHFPKLPEGAPLPATPPPRELIEVDTQNPATGHLEQIYADDALATRMSDNLVATSSTSQPGLVASMLQILELAPGMRVLEIGAGTGWNAALMAELVGDPALVTTLDIQEDVVAQTRRLLAAAGYGDVRLHQRDGYLGAPESAPFDRIVATVGCTDLSPRWAEQLASDGFMLIPLTHGSMAPLVRVWREGGRLRGRVVAPAGFMRIQGTLAQVSPWPLHLQNPRAPKFENAREMPPLPDLMEKPETAEQWQLYIGWAYFLAARDRRKFSNFAPSGLGLDAGERGAVLTVVNERRVLLKGDPALYDELLAHWQAWQALGRPALTDFEMEFLPLNDDPAPADAVATIDRVFYRQALWVTSSRGLQMM